MLSGVIAVDQLSGEQYTFCSDVIINATGVFVDDIMGMDAPQSKKKVKPSQGVHLIVDSKFLGGNSGLMIPKTKDGRVLFGVPWHGKVVLGTTDTPLNESVLEPRALEEEINFILDQAGPVSRIETYQGRCTFRVCRFTSLGGSNQSGHQKNERNFQKSQNIQI